MTDTKRFCYRYVVRISNPRHNADGNPSFRMRFITVPNEQSTPTVFSIFPYLGLTLVAKMNVNSELTVLILARKRI